MKKLNATTIIFAVFLPIVLAFGGYVHKKIDDHDDELVFLGTSREYTKEDIKEIKDDISTMKNDNKEILLILRKL